MKKEESEQLFTLQEVQNAIREALEEIMKVVMPKQAIKEVSK